MSLNLKGSMKMKILFLSGVAFCILAAIVLSGAKTSAADDQEVVAALDTQYQEAVKKNDVATMDRILTDDFILVTASGKTYSKADLLREARGGSTIYEHQEDTERTVRVWGHTAVVTAKLWEKGTESGKPFDHTPCRMAICVWPIGALPMPKVA